MDSIILIFVCIVVGSALRWAKAIPANGHVALNTFVIYISLPSLALYYIPKIEISTQLLYPLGVAWLGFAFAWLLFGILGKRLNWSKKLTGCLILTAGLGNTSFVGFPVIEALYGKEGLKTAIIVGQPGSFVVLSTLGILVAAAYSRSAPGGMAIAKRILFFPPFIAFGIALFMNFSNFDFVDALQVVFQRLCSTVTPVALVAVGLQLRIDSRSRHWKFLALGLGYKLILMPLLFYILYRLILKGNSVETDVSIIEAAMAPMITASILASSHGLKPRLAGMMIGVGIPLSLATLAAWYCIITYL